MSWLMRLFKKSSDGTTVTLQSEVTGGLVAPKFTAASGAAIDEFSTDGTMAGDSDTAVPTEKAVKTYVASNTAGLKWKAPVRVATTTNGTIGTAYANGQTVDGKTLATGDRILLKDQSDQTVNGIYTVNATGAPTRATDADTGTEILGCVVAVLEGDTNEDSAWCNTNSTAITIGSSNITFAIFGGMKAGNGLTFTADVASIDTTIVCDLSTAQALTKKSLSLLAANLLAETGTPVLTFGSMDTPYTSTKVANLIPWQVKILQTTDIGSGNTVGAAYFRVSTGLAQTGQLAVVMVRTYVSHNVFDAYGLQSHIVVDASMQTVNANAHLTAISGKVTLTGTPTITKGWLNAILGIWEGAGTVSQMGHVCSLVQEAGSTGCQSLLHLNTDVAATPIMSIACVDGDGNAVYTSAPQTLEGSFTVLINGTPKYVPFYSTQHI